MPYKTKEARMAYYEKHREEILAKNKADRDADPVGLKSRKRLEYIRNRERYLACANARWQEMEYWEQKHHNSLGKARTKGAEIIDTDSIREYYREVFTRTTSVCTYCGHTFSIDQITVDHRHPFAKGGRHEVSNFVVSCLGCNMKKHAKLFEVWQSRNK